MVSTSSVSSISPTLTPTPTISSSSVTIHSTSTLETTKTVISNVVTSKISTPTTTMSSTVTPTPFPACEENEYQCSDGVCIKQSYVCDGRPHCSRGEDEEQGCECTADQFRCSSGQCIQDNFRCDKVIHCKDSSDEMNCTGCDGFQCKSGLCLWTNTVVCDGVINCMDLSDEMNCNVDRGGYSQCNNGMWIRDDRYCDGVDDCFDNSDETDCAECNIVSELPCATGPSCIMFQWKCDGHDDCPEGWDESNYTCGMCQPNEFKCSNHTCIPDSEVCDGRKQCMSGTDEIDCVKLYNNDNSLSSQSGVVKLSSSGQMLPVCSDVWSANLTVEVCQYFGHSAEGATSTFVSPTSVGLSTPSSYMLAQDIKTKLKDEETVLSRFESTQSCSSQKIVSVTCQPCECGERQVDPFISFIVGGSLAPAGQWPWVVSLSLLGKGVCGGTIVGPRWILTAAHCIVNEEADYTTTPHYFEVTAGTNTRTRTENDNAQRRRVDKIVLHPNTSRLDNWLTDWDMALLHLETPLQYGDYLQPICLPTQDENFATNSLCYLAGWGFINTQERTVDYLREAKMRLWNDEECSESALHQDTGININSTICAGYHSGIISGCKGDSGSPLMCKDNRDHWNVVGIMSYGSSGCDGHSGTANRMAKVSAASDWISSVIKT
ncbi:Enteropeptidase [Mactra antiquata]